jgi:hypothetical protein
MGWSMAKAGLYVKERDKILLFMGWNMAKAGLYVKEKVIQHVV